MAKSELVGLLLLVFIVEICMYVFVGVTTVGTALYDLLVSGSLFSASGFWTWITDNLFSVIGLIGGGIIIGTLLTSNRDFVIFAGITLVFISYGAIFGKLIGILAREFDRFFSLSGGTFLATLIVAPIIILYIVVILKFWRGTD